MLVLEERRRACNLTQSRTAAEIGVQTRHIIDYEKGRSLPTPDQLEALGRLFRVPPAILLLPVRVPELDAMTVAEAVAS